MMISKALQPVKARRFQHFVIYTQHFFLEKAWQSPFLHV